MRAQWTPSVILGGPFSRKGPKIRASKKIIELLCTVYSEAIQESAEYEHRTDKRKAIETIRGIEVIERRSYQSYRQRRFRKLYFRKRVLSLGTVARLICRANVNLMRLFFFFFFFELRQSCKAAL